MKPTILIFGNPLVEIDNLPPKILPKLKKLFPKINFLHLDPTENLESHGPDLKIIDVVFGIKEPKIITKIDELKTQKIYSMHDFDLAYNLKLLEKLEKINSVEILGLPMKICEEDALKAVEKWINSA